MIAFIQRFLLMTEVVIFGKMKIILRNFFLIINFARDWTKTALLHSTTLQWIMTNKKRRKHMLSFSARSPAKSCIPIFTEKPVAMVTIMQMRWNYTVGHLFPPDIHPESFIKIASLVVEISSESISRPVSYLNRAYMGSLNPLVNVNNGSDEGKKGRGTMCLLGSFDSNAQ